MIGLEALAAVAIGTLTSVGVYLCLKRRSFDVVLGLTLLSYAVNLLIFAMGRLLVNRAPIIDERALSLANYTDPLPQALVLTAIVISFAMTALLVAMALKANALGDDDLERGDDP
jgi:multicomponent K+:H+ antiporter subunit C